MFTSNNTDIDIALSWFLHFDKPEAEPVTPKERPSLTSYRITGLSLCCARESKPVHRTVAPVAPR